MHPQLLSHLPNPCLQLRPPSQGISHFVPNWATSSTPRSGPRKRNQLFPPGCSIRKRPGSCDTGTAESCSSPQLPCPRRAGVPLWEKQVFLPGAARCQPQRRMSFARRLPVTQLGQLKAGSERARRQPWCERGFLCPHMPRARVDLGHFPAPIRRRE